MEALLADYPHLLLRYRVELRRLKGDCEGCGGGKLQRKYRDLLAQIKERDKLARGK